MPAILPPYYVDAPAIVRPAEPVAGAVALSGFQGSIVLVSGSTGPNASGAVRAMSGSTGPNAAMQTASGSTGPNASSTMKTMSGSTGPNSSLAVPLGPTGAPRQTSPLSR